MASANVGDCLSGAWGIFKNNAITHVVCTLLVMVVASISAGLLAGPMVVGYMRMIEREARGESVQIGDIFRGFDDFVPAFVAGLISSLVVSLGFMLCFIPGLLVMALPPVALFLVARGERDGVAAFNQAWSLVTKNLGSAFFFFLFLFTGAGHRGFSGLFALRRGRAADASAVHHRLLLHGAPVGGR